MNHKITLAAFDFDGTITAKDTFVEIIRFSKGTLRCYAGFLLFSPMLVAMKLKLYPNGKVKQQIFSFFFKGMKLTEFNKICESFAYRSVACNAHIIKYIEQHQKYGNKIVIISASVENWLRPFAAKLGISDVIGTKLETDENGILTGKFASANCYGQEKVNRLLEKFPDRNDYYLIAYGDSCGDRELLAFADKRVLIK
ncbi:MAG: HAD-IB family hydrolase [Bacteroidales bacterium]|nr:HAD-IB family hydrolase [Bacteroidales bacterium]